MNQHPPAPWPDDILMQRAIVRGNWRWQPLGESAMWGWVPWPPRIVTPPRENVTRRGAHR
jgi:hypothetical protein